MLLALNSVVHQLITDLAVFEFSNNAMKLVELQEGVSLDQVKEKTEAEFEVRL
ncbi:hypothetical protein HpBT340_13830 [Helicobacter pylori]